MGWEKVEVIDPAFLKGAKADEVLSLFGDPHLARCEDRFAKECLVVFEGVQLGQIGEEVRA